MRDLPLVPRDPVLSAKMCQSPVYHQVLTLEGNNVLRNHRYPPTRVFWKKRLQAIENKGNECGKACKETPKRPQALEKDGFATEAQSAQRKPWRALGS